MKIEKVNDQQIRCTLTKADLIDRELKISELAYGTEKAKDLFRDMMQQASYEFGFEAEDIPLMIEAIPLNPDCIVLIITKVEDPEELDTRFSKFAPSIHEDDLANTDEMESIIEQLSDRSDDVLDLLKKIQVDKFDENIPASSKSCGIEPRRLKAKNSIEPLTCSDLTRMFSFPSIASLAKVAHVLNGYYNGKNSLYRNPRHNTYILSITKSDHTPAEFNKTCNVISEYGVSKKYTAGCEAYLNEHCNTILDKNALQSLLSL